MKQNRSNLAILIAIDAAKITFRYILVNQNLDTDPTALDPFFSVVESKF
jgi:hypothetical protein